MKRLLMVLLCTSSTGFAQVCAPGQTLLRNDTLAPVPSTVSTVGMFSGMCDNEAIGAVFNVAPVGSAVKINQASIGFVALLGASGFTAAVDFELFDGVTFAGNVPVLGPSLFRFSTATGSNLQVQSTAINTGPDLS